MISTENRTCMHIQIIKKVLCALSLRRNVIEVTWSVNCQELLWANKIVQYTAVFTLLLYKYVFYSSCSIVEIYLFVYPYLYWYFARFWYFIDGILSVFWWNWDSVIFLRPRWQPYIFFCWLLYLFQLPKLIPFWNTKGGLREDIKYYFADFVCKGEGGYPQIRNSFLAKNVVRKVGERGTPQIRNPFFDLKNRCIWAKNTILALFEDKFLGKCP